MNLREKRHRTWLFVAMVSVLMVVCATYVVANDRSDSDATVAYGSTTLPYGGVVVPWDTLTDGALYYVIQNGEIAISFEGHDARGVEVMLAGSGLITNYNTSQIYGHLEKTTAFTIDGKTVTLVMVPGYAENLPIYGGVDTTFDSYPDAKYGEYYSNSRYAYTKSGVKPTDIPNFTVTLDGSTLQSYGLSISFSWETVKSGTYGMCALITGTPTKTITDGELVLTYTTTAFGKDTFTYRSSLTIVGLVVTYNANGGNCSTSSATWTTSSGSLTLPSATRTDYNFLGWYTQSSGGTKVGTANDSYTPTGDITLYAQWEQKAVSVTGITITGSSSVTKGNSITLTAVTSPDGASNRWVNWSISSGSSYVEITSVTKTKTGGTVTLKGLAVGTATIIATADDGGGASKTYSVTVKQEVVTYSFSLKYDANGGKGAPSTFNDTSTNNYYDTTVSTVQPTKSGYDFLGWATSKTATSPDYQGGYSIRLSTGTTTLYAVWQEQTEYWYLYYDAGSGTGAPSYQRSLVSSSSTSHSFTISNTLPTRDGYDFAGWSRTNGSTTAAFQPGGSITVTSPSTTLYAVWKEIVVERSFILQFYLDGGYGGPGEVNVVDTGTSYTTSIGMEVPVKVGYDFAGWGENAGTGTVRYKPGDSIVLSEGTTTLYAVWKQTNYVLLFDTDGGEPTSYTIEGKGASDGYTFSIPSDYVPSKTGYTFGGWSETRGGTAVVQSGSSYTVSKTTTLYAVWTEVIENITYNVSYDVGEGTGAPTSQNVTFPEDQTATIELSDVTPTRAGYDFVGWSDVEGSDIALYQPSETITLKTVNTVLHAVWSMQPVRYVLSYNGNHDSVTGVPEPDVAEVAATEHTFIVSDAIPVRENYLFVGWSENPDAVSIAQYIGGSEITVSERETILYAVWVLDNKDWILEFDANGGTGAPNRIEEQAPGNEHTFSIPNSTPEWEHHTFLGWSTEMTAQSPSVLKGGSFVTSNSVNTLYAVWQLDPTDTFTVVFDLRGGTGIIGMGPFQGYGEYATTLPLDRPSSDVGLFMGWTTAIGGDAEYQPGDPIVLQSGTTYLYAVWSDDPIIDYTLSFDANGGTGGPTPQQESTRDVCTIRVPGDIPVREGYTFMGWSESRDGDVAVMPDEDYVMHGTDVTLYAVWQGNTPYRLTFDANGGTDVPDDIAVEGEPGGHTFRIPAKVPTKEGYTFIGWATTADGVAEYIADMEYTVTTEGTHTLHAVWTKDTETRTFTLAFDANGGTGGPSAMTEETEEYLVSFTVPGSEPTRDGYTFMGWSETPDGDVKFRKGDNVAVAEMNSVDGTRTLYAVWAAREDTRFELVLDPNGGSDAPVIDPIVSSDGSVTFTLPMEEPVRDGYTFRGWSTSATGKAVYYPGEAVTVGSADATVRLYAVWQNDSDVVLDAHIKVSVNGREITFDASSSQGFTNVLWSFGDGTTSDQVSGKHTYETNGNYIVKLTVYNGGESDSKTIAVSINETEGMDTTKVVILAAVSVLILFCVVRFIGLA